MFDRIVKSWEDFGQLPPQLKREMQRPSHTMLVDAIEEYVLGYDSADEPDETKKGIYYSMGQGDAKNGTFGSSFRHLVEKSLTALLGIRQRQRP